MEVHNERLNTDLLLFQDGVDRKYARSNAVRLNTNIFQDELGDTTENSNFLLTPIEEYSMETDKSIIDDKKELRLTLKQKELHARKAKIFKPAPMPVVKMQEWQQPSFIAKKQTGLAIFTKLDPKKFGKKGQQKDEKVPSAQKKDESKEGASAQKMSEQEPSKSKEAHTSVVLKKEVSKKEKYKPIPFVLPKKEVEEVKLPDLIKQAVIQPIIDKANDLRRMTDHTKKIGVLHEEEKQPTEYNTSQKIVISCRDNPSSVGHEVVE